MGKDLKGKELGTGLGQRKDGLYTARFTTKRGKRLQYYSPKLRECKRWLADNQFKDEPVSVDIPTLNEWFEVWVEAKEAVVKKSTMYIYLVIYNTNIKPTLGSFSLDEIKPVHCQQLLSSHRSKAQNTIGSIRTLLHNILEYAVDNEIIDKNPVTKKVKVVSQKEKKERRVLSREEQERFVKDMQNNLYGNVYMFLLQTGLRIGELTALCWENVDLENRMLYVRHTMVKIGNKYFLSSPKSKSGIRDIPLTEKALQILNSIQKNSFFDKQGFVFKKISGYRVSSINSSLLSYCRKRKIESFSLHTLRHTFATRCIENGMKPKTLQSILGHSKISMTMDLYVHSTNETKKEEMLKIEGLL